MNLAEQIKEAYENHKKRFNYVPPKTEEKDLYFLTNCFKEDYIKSWLRAMEQNPPKFYPLELVYMPTINKWVDLYLQVGAISGKPRRAGLGAFEFLVKPECLQEVLEALQIDTEKPFNWGANSINLTLERG